MIKMSLNTEIEELQKKAEAYERLKNVRDEVAKSLMEAQKKIADALHVLSPTVAVFIGNGNKRGRKSNAEFQQKLDDLYNLLRGGTSLSRADVEKFLNVSHNSSQYPYKKLRVMSNVKERDVRDGVYVKNLYI
jgi:16S rRNA G1207 methylase RsmC